MDHLYGLRRALGLVVLWCVLASGALAQSAPPVSNPIPPGGVAPVWTKQFVYGSPPQFGPADAGSVCSSIAGTAHDPAVYGKVVANGDDAICEVHGPRGDNGQDYVKTSVGIQAVWNYVCSNGGVLSQASGGFYCACPHGVSGAGACNKVDPVPHSCPGMGTVSPDDGNRYTYTGMGTGGGYCNNGCGYWPEAVAVDSSGAGQYSYGGGIATGQSCGANAAAGAPNPDTSGPTPAPNGTQQSGDAANCKAPTACSGQVNGTTVCVPCGTPTTTTASQTTSTPASGAAPSTSTTTTSTATNPDGSTTTTTSTHNSDGSSSQTVTTGPAGSSGGGGAGQGGGNCPGTDCGNSDSFGGSCSASFTCTGDAVQCAIAKEQHQRDCLMFQPETQPGTWANGAQALQTAINDGDVPTWSPAHPGNAQANNFNWASTIDHSSAIASSCPADITFTMVGQSVAIGFGALCANAGIVGNFFVGIAAILCAFILFKGQH